MQPASKYRPLAADQIERLERNGCVADGGDWGRVRVADGFDAGRVRNTTFSGTIRIGTHAGAEPGAAPAGGLVGAHLVDCSVGDRVRIANVGVRVANYDVGADACIEDVGTLATRPGATFGNGVQIDVLNEAGGRPIVLHNELCAQLAYLVCLYRHRPIVVEKLQQMVETAAAAAKSDRGTIGPGACIRSAGEIIDVAVGAAATLSGPARLVNGTVLSDRRAPTTIGAGVQAEDFIVAEGATVTGAAMLTGTYVGQGCRIGRQFSAEASVFFANCEGFHGEVCSTFAGPYTVTHHKSTLLIAGLFSFYNAGSGTNFSNHRYKLGPLHEGKLERGSKTGSFSYLMWPCRVGPFSVVLGKHTRVFDTADFPFSTLSAKADGQSVLLPGINLATVGTVRDGDKWPRRDRRHAAARRDRICFDVLSPYTVGRMVRGAEVLDQLQKTTDRSRASVAVGGAEVKRVLLRTGSKYYRRAITMYLAEQIVSHVEAACAEGATSLAEAVATAPGAVAGETWVDLAGQLMPAARLDDFCRGVEQGQLADLAACRAELDRAFAAYRQDEWVWTKQAYRKLFKVDLDQADRAQFRAVADAFGEAKRDFLKMVRRDAEKEFDEPSRIGFGLAGDDESAAADFAAVRGRLEENAFVVDVQQQIDALGQRVERFKQLVGTL